MLVLPALLIAGCASESEQVLTTIADARENPAAFVDVGAPGDSVGDILTFDQPLLDSSRHEIGTNSGTCIRTRPGHSFQCQWTLSLADGTIQVAGREFDAGVSPIAIIGGTGAYAGATGEMTSTNNGDGTFTQTLRFRRTGSEAPSP